MLIAFVAVTAAAGVSFGLFVASLAPVKQGAVLSASSAPTATEHSNPVPSSAPLVPTGGVVLELEGTGNLTTDAFAVEPGWQVIWQTDGTRFSYAVHGAQDLGEVINVTKPSKGANAFAPAGTFRIEIAAAGPWTIKVLQGGQ